MDGKIEKRLTEYGKFHKGDGGGRCLARSTKKFNRKISPFLKMGGGGLTQSIKSLTEKVKENPYFHYREGGQENWQFFHILSVFFTFDSSRRKRVFYDLADTKRG